MPYVSSNLLVAHASCGTSGPSSTSKRSARVSSATCLAQISSPGRWLRTVPHFVLSFPSSLSWGRVGAFELAFGSCAPNFRRMLVERAARATGCRKAHSGVLAQLHGTKELSCKKRLGWSWASRGSLYEVSAASIGHFYLVDRLIVLCTAPSMARE